MKTELITKNIELFRDGAVELSFAKKKHPAPIASPNTNALDGGIDNRLATRGNEVNLNHDVEHDPKSRSFPWRVNHHVLSSLHVARTKLSAFRKRHRLLPDLLFGDDAYNLFLPPVCNYV